MEENFGMKFNMEWKIYSMEWKWIGRKLPVWKNHLPFHTMPCRDTLVQICPLFADFRPVKFRSRGRGRPQTGNT